MNEENNKLIPLVDFIKKIDSDFPKSVTRDEMRNLVLIKYQSIVEYAKFLEKPLTIEMFEGDAAIFKGGKYHDVQPSREWNYYSISGYKIFQDSNGRQNNSYGRKVSDLTHLRLTYNHQSLTPKEK